MSLDVFNRLIFCAYAYGDMKTSANMNSCDDKMNIYLKNTVVSLVSAKINNPNCDVALVTNIDIPKNYESIFKKFNVLIFKEDFDEFVFDKDYKWGLAFYKLCALKKMLKKQYKSYLLLDTDTYTQSSLDDLWEETEHNIMLYPLTHRMTIPNCKAFNEEIFQFCGIKRPLTNYGGEFIAGDYKLLCDFMAECDRIYNEMLEKKHRTNRGDEFIVRIAADRMRDKVKTAGGYVFRFWTGMFYLVSTCYKYDAISVLHMPDEKRRGIIKIYEYIFKHNSLPSNNKVYSLCRLKSMPIKHKIKTFINDWKNR